MKPKSYQMSLGYLATLLQRSPAELERMLEDLGIAPAVSIDGIHHFDEDAYCALADAVESNQVKTREIRANG